MYLDELYSSYLSVSIRILIIFLIPWVLRNHINSIKSSVKGCSDFCQGQWR